jgi:hypothetical protein
MTQMEVYAVWALLAFAAVFCLFVVTKILLIGKNHKDEEAAMNDREAQAKVIPGATYKKLTEEEQLHILNDIQAYLTDHAIKKWRVDAALKSIEALGEDKSPNRGDDPCGDDAIYVPRRE